MTTSKLMGVLHGNSFWRKMEDPSNEKYLIRIILGLSSFFSILSLVLVPVSLSIDSYSYIKGGNPVRPGGYDFILDVATGSSHHAIFITIILQLVLTFISPFLIFVSLKKFSYALAFFISLVFMLIPYRYLMALQIMTESLYIFVYSIIFCIYFIYLRTNKIKFLVYGVVICLVGSTLRPTFIFFVLPLLYLVLLRVVKYRSLYLNFLITILISLAILFGVPKLLSSGSAKNLPFFVWHYIVQCPDNQDATKSCLVRNKDTHTQTLNNRVYSALKSDLIFFDAMAADFGPRGEVLRTNSSFLPKSDANLQKLTDYLLFERQNNMHIGANFVVNLWRIYGEKETTELLLKVIAQTFIQNPSSMLSWFFLTQNENLLINTSINLVHDTSYWWFIPVKAEEAYLLNSFPLGSGSYSAWVNNLDKRTGSDDSIKIGSGSEEKTRTIKYLRQAADSLNLVFFAQFFSTQILQFYSYVAVVLSPFAILNLLDNPLIFMSVPFYLLISLIILLILLKNLRTLFPIVVYLTVWAVIYIAWLSAPSPRHLVMHLPALILSMGLFFIKPNSTKLELSKIKHKL